MKYFIKFLLLFLFSNWSYAMEYEIKDGIAINAEMKSSNNFEEIQEEIMTISSSICPICKQELNQGQSITSLKCGEGKIHSYCTECIRAWAKIQLAKNESPNCPYCLTKINQDLITFREKFVAFNQRLVNGLSSWISKGHLIPGAVILIYWLIDSYLNANSI